MSVEHKPTAGCLRQVRLQGRPVSLRLRGRIPGSISGRSRRQLAAPGADGRGQKITQPKGSAGGRVRNAEILLEKGKDISQLLQNIRVRRAEVGVVVKCAPLAEEELPGFGPGRLRSAIVDGNTGRCRSVAFRCSLSTVIVDRGEARYLILVEAQNFGGFRRLSDDIYGTET